MRIKQISRRLKFESLETRRMLDGVISTTFTNGTLTLFGDNASNAVLITNSSPGVVELIGLNTTANSVTSPTLINTHTSQFFTNVVNIVVNFNGGTTGVNTGNDALFITGLSINGGLGIQTGDGNNTYTLGQFDNSGNLIDSTYNSLIGSVTLGTGLAINMGGGDNTLTANQVTLHGPVGNNLNIKAGDGTNDFTFTNTTVTHAANIVDTGALTVSFDNFTANNLNVVSGIGNDNISLSESTINGKININTDFGNDVVELDDHVNAGSFDVVLGPGDDHLTTDDTVTVAGETTIRGGLDDDTIDLTSFSSKSLNVLGVGGDDTITLTSVTVTAATTVDGGDGADTITLNGVGSSSLLVTGGTGFDNISLTNVNVLHTATVSGGLGNDTVNLDHVSAGILNANLGVGTDHLTLDTITAQNANLDGGDGNDLFDLTSLNVASLSVTLDKGADTVTAHNNSVTGTALFAGGLGDDTYTDLGGNVYGTFTPKSIEHGV